VAAARLQLVQPIVTRRVLAAVALHRTPLGEVTALPQTPVDGLKGREGSIRKRPVANIDHTHHN